MSEIKVGEYVRSLVNGRISKVLEVSDLLEEPNVKYYKTGKITGFCSTELYNIKHSLNIIDLIEVGDYVNGEKVKAIGYPFKESVKEVIFEDDGHTPKIATILTKEQFLESEYKVNE